MKMHNASWWDKKWHTVHVCVCVCRGAVCIMETCAQNNYLWIRNKTDQICVFSGAWEQLPESLLFLCSLTWNSNKPVSRMKQGHTHCTKHTHRGMHVCVHAMYTSLCCVCTVDCCTVTVSLIGDLRWTSLNVMQTFRWIRLHTTSAASTADICSVIIQTTHVCILKKSSPTHMLLLLLFYECHAIVCCVKHFNDFMSCYMCCLPLMASLNLMNS